MPSAFEIAPSGRATCRGCRRAIAKESLRFGERMENPFGDGEMTLWFHPPCGALKRPEPFLETLAAAGEEVELEARDTLVHFAEEGLAHRRLPRLHGAERDPSGRATCRSCRDPIEKESWRFSLVYYQEGRFEPSGFIHVRCAGEYFETADILERVRWLTDLPDEALGEIGAELRRGAGDG